MVDDAERFRATSSHGDVDLKKKLKKRRGEADEKREEEKVHDGIAAIEC